MPAERALALSSFISKRNIIFNRLKRTVEFMSNEPWPKLLQHNVSNITDYKNLLLKEFNNV